MSTYTGWRQGGPVEVETDSLADQLICNPSLRAEVLQRVGVRSVGEPSRAYKEWKHRSNSLADARNIKRCRQVELIIERAIEHTKEQAS